MRIRIRNITQRCGCGAGERVWPCGPAGGQPGCGGGRGSGPKSSHLQAPGLQGRAHLGHCTQVSGQGILLTRVPDPGHFRPDPDPSCTHLKNQFKFCLHQISWRYFHVEFFSVEKIENLPENLKILCRRYRTFETTLQGRMRFWIRCKIFRIR